MEKKFNAYETLFVVNGSEEEYKATVEKFVALVKENATDVTVDEWGKRKLAYPINKINEGYYVLVNFKSEPTFPLEFERVLGITENVMRYMTTSKIAGEAKVAVVADAKAEENVEVAAEATEA